MCTYIQRTLLQSLIQWTCIKSQGGHKAYQVSLYQQQVTITLPFDGHAQSCFALPFVSECSCSAQLTHILYMISSFRLLYNFTQSIFGSQS